MGYEMVRVATVRFWIGMVWVYVAAVMPSQSAFAAGGSLTVSVRDEADEQPVITRMVLERAGKPSRLVKVRKTVPAGVGLVLDRSAEFSLPDGQYRFSMIRGPEYRIITGNFSLERTSLDDHSVALPRMVEMLQEGWTSGDCCVPPSPYSLPLRMASEDLHLATVLGRMDAKPIAGRADDEPPENDPSWINEKATHEGGLLFYRSQASNDPNVNDEQIEAGDDSGASDERNTLLPVERMVQQGPQDDVKIAIENPFAWQLPVWLASGQVDGFFLLGDWLRLDRRVLSIADGRGPQGVTAAGSKAIGRWAEKIYWNMLEAGFRIPPLAGTGDQGRQTPVGYNRLYVGKPPRDYNGGPLKATRVQSELEWWNAAWRGQSVATNGPLLRPMLGGQLPGHVFKARVGEVLVLQAELQLAVRDPVEYLEVIHNGKVHYSARLDEFAKAGGMLPPVNAKESGWVTIRVVTLYEDHFRAAMSAPWYIEFEGQPRVTRQSVEFFRQWLSEYEGRLKQLPNAELQRHVPFVRAARKFWTRKADEVTPN
ncbi:hypothetical protein OAH22_03020 [bacterium]|nr:hypothetical protein [bacterium]